MKIIASLISGIVLLTIYLFNNVLIDQEYIVKSYRYPETLDTCEIDIEADIIKQIEEPAVTTFIETEELIEDIIEDIPETTELIIDDIEPTVVYNITEEERELLARLVYQESGICSIDVKKAVVSVIFNRLDSGRWKKDINLDGIITIYDIIYYPNAFSPAHLLPTTIPTEDCYEAVDYVVTNGATIPTYVRYFRNKHHFSWEGYKGYFDVENMYFGYFINWEKGAW